MMEKLYLWSFKCNMQLTPANFIDNFWSIVYEDSLKLRVARGYIQNDLLTSIKSTHPIIMLHVYFGIIICLVLGL